MYLKASKGEGVTAQRSLRDLPVNGLETLAHKVTGRVSCLFLEFIRPERRGNTLSDLIFVISLYCCVSASLLRSLFVSQRQLETKMLIGEWEAYYSGSYSSRYVNWVEMARDSSSRLCFDDGGGPSGFVTTMNIF
jgi:hypothetical protein